MFWILAFYAVYVLAVLVGAVRRKTLGSTLKHMLLFGVPSAVIIVGRCCHLQNHPDNRLRRYLRRLLRRRLWQQLPGPAAHPGTDLAGALRGRLGVAAVLPQHPCTGYCSRRGQPGGDGAVYPYPVPGRPPEPDPCAFYLLMLFGLCTKLTQQKAKPWLRNAAAGVLAVFLVVNFGNALRLPGKNVQTLA